MRNKLRQFAIVASLLSVLLAAPVAAQDIVDLNQEGIAAFSEGRFADAAQKFNEAYAISAEPPLKKNEALAWFKAERCAEALGAAKEYLSLQAGDELSTSEARTIAVRCHVQRAEAELAAGNLEAAEASLNDARANQPAAEDQQKIAAIDADVQARRAAIPPPIEPSRGNGLGKGKLGIGLMATGGAVVLGTLIYHVVLATSTTKQFKDAADRGDRARYDELGQRLETARWLLPTLYVVGGATAGVGAYFWWSATKENSPASAQRGGIDSVGATLVMQF